MKKIMYVVLLLVSCIKNYSMEPVEDVSDETPVSVFYMGSETGSNLGPAGLQYFRDNVLGKCSQADCMDYLLNLQNRVALQELLSGGSDDFYNQTLEISKEMDKTARLKSGKK